MQFSFCNSGRRIRSNTVIFDSRHPFSTHSFTPDRDAASVGGRDHHRTLPPPPPALLHRPESFLPVHSLKKLPFHLHRHPTLCTGTHPHPKHLPGPLAADKIPAQRAASPPLSSPPPSKVLASAPLRQPGQKRIPTTVAVCFRLLDVNLPDNASNPPLRVFPPSLGSRAPENLPPGPPLRLTPPTAA